MCSRPAGQEGNGTGVVGPPPWLDIIIYCLDKTARGKMPNGLGATIFVVL